MRPSDQVRPALNPLVLASFMFSLRLVGTAKLGHDGSAKSFEIKPGTVLAL